MPEYDLLITNASIIDGSGGEPVHGAVAVRGDRIAAVGDVSDAAARTIDAGGHAVAPGFIDVHAHDDAAVLLYDSASGEIWSIAEGGAVTAMPRFVPPRGGGFTQLYALFSLPDRLLIEAVTASGDVYVSAPRP